MSKRLLTLAFFAVLCVGASAWVARSAQAGPSLCGNGNVDTGEQCDDGNTVNDPNAGGTETCSFPSCRLYTCGDGQPNPDIGQVCDDGNTVNDDDCANDCTSNCGNGVPNGTEQCDDGNTIDDDTCNNQCQFTADPNTKDEQACVNAVNKNVAGIAKAVSGNDTACLKAIQKGDPNTCLDTDPKQKVANAQAKTTATFNGSKCDNNTPPITLALTTDTTVNPAAPAQIKEGRDLIFGTDPAIFVTSATNKDSAKCQAEALKQYNTLVGKFISEANKAKKTSQKGGKNQTPPPAGNNATIASDIDTAITNSTAISKAEAKALANLQKKCDPATVDSLFDCGGATTPDLLSVCIGIVARQAGCETLEIADGLDLTCPSLP